MPRIKFHRTLVMDLIKTQYLLECSLKNLRASTVNYNLKALLNFHQLKLLEGFKN